MKKAANKQLFSLFKIGLISLKNCYWIVTARLFTIFLADVAV